MGVFSHALFYTLLVGTGIISGLFSLPSANGVPNNALCELQIIEKADETLELEEKTELPSETSYDTAISIVKVYRSKSGKIEEMELEKYVEGVLLAEMPTWYGEEALKAAAVATRTYTLYKMNSTSHNTGADICDNPAHCQAFYKLEDAVEVWSEDSADTAVEKIRLAVRDTKGKIIVYDNKPILAVYHASSYLKTRSSEEVFGGEVEYLQSVSVPFEDKENTRFSEKAFSSDEVKRILSDETGLKNADSFNSVWEKNKCIGVRVNSDNESVVIPSSRVRTVFSLASSNFEIEEKDGKTVFKVYGFGHGVGLSQQGAGILAERGWKWNEIVLHYYKNTEIANLKK